MIIFHVVLSWQDDRLYCIYQAHIVWNTHIMMRELDLLRHKRAALLKNEKKKSQVDEKLLPNRMDFINVLKLKLQPVSCV